MGDGSKSLPCDTSLPCPPLPATCVSGAVSVKGQSSKRGVWGSLSLQVFPVLPVEASWASGCRGRGSALLLV